MILAALKRKRVLKNTNKKIEKDLALRIYRENDTSRSLVVCYGDLGQWDVLIEIYKYITKNAKKSISSQKQENELTS